MKSKYQWFMVVCALLLGISLLNGCFYKIPDGYQPNPHTKTAAQTYINEYLKTENITLADNYEDIKDEYGTKIRRWRAAYGDVSFYVASRQKSVWDSTGEFSKYYYAMTTDYNLCFTQKMFAETAQESKTLLQIDGVEEYRRYRDDVYVEVIVNEKAEIASGLDQAEAFYDAVKSSYPDMPLHCSFRTWRPYADTTVSVLFLTEFSDAAYEEIFNNYCVEKNRFLEAFDFTKEEISLANRACETAVSVKKGGNLMVVEELSTFDNYSDTRITYETFYALLKKLDYDVQGEKDDYNFTGADGAVYRISRAYKREKSETFYGVTHTYYEYYYKKNDEEVMIKAIGFADHFGNNEVSSMTDIELL